MELKEFVKQVLTDITDAVSELQGELQNGAIISPSLPHPIANGSVVKPDNVKSNMPISKIEFDVATTAGSTDKIGGGMKGGIHVFSAKVDGENEAREENVSRVRFSIPVVLPVHYTKSAQDIVNDIGQAQVRKQRAKADAENNATTSGNKE